MSIRPIPANYVSQKPVFAKKNGSLAKTSDVPYISWTDCLMILDYICPEYDYEITENQVGDRHLNINRTIASNGSNKPKQLLKMWKMC